MNQLEQLRFLILAAQREGNRMLASELLEYGLTPSQAEVIRLIDDYGELIIGGIGELLICESGTNPSRLVNRLALMGLIKKTVTADDKRQIMVTLTKSGFVASDVIKQIENNFYHEIESVCNGIDIQPTIELLSKITDGTPAGEAFSKRIS
jgi:DNA-binding MarR family transcriptional regulator